MIEMNDRLTVSIAGADKELFMPFAQLSELARLVPSVEDLAQIILNPDLREAALGVVLSERDPEGKVTVPFELAKSNISTAVVSQILDWVMENLTDFFMGAVVAAHRLQVKHTATVQGLTSSPGGSAS